MELNSICVFCGSSMGRDKKYARAALELAETFLEYNISLVYGGANVGLMKILADTMLVAGGKAIGVMPQSLVEKEVAHQNLSKLHIVESMQERKLLMASLSDAFITMPGGYGTLDELAEMMTFNQLRIHEKPLGILNTNGYFDKLLDFFDHGVTEMFVRAEHRDNLIIDRDPHKLLRKMQDYKPVGMEKWIREIKKESS